jgi:glucose-6-phosphate 1-dehydrogenase
MISDPTLFQRADGVEAGWRAVQPLLDVWEEAGALGLGKYMAGSGGPPEADDLLRRDGRQWRMIPA